MGIEVLDFQRSFLVFEVDFDRQPPKTVTDARQNRHNRARIQIVCRCRITEPDGKAIDYYLGGACKTERVGAGRDTGIFSQPNADFQPILSDEETLLLKSWERNDPGVMLVPPSLGPQPERQLIPTRDAFWRHAFLLSRVAGRPLRAVEEILAAVDAGQPLVARTAWETSGYRVLLEYPIVTLNVSERHGSYQTDTGPVLFPDLGRAHTRPIESFQLAFAAFNCPEWTEFILQMPTPVGGGISVNHYAETRWIDGDSEIIGT
jgi:hypothetical protein